MQYDVIVIGSGLGGLTAAAKLAKEGKKVIVIEQHSVVGGCATSFTRKNYTVDVGLHAIDGVYSKGPKLDLFNDLDVFINVEFVHDDTGFYRFYNGRTDIIVPDNPKEAIKVLTKHFPHEAKAIKEYYKTILAISDEVLRVPTGWKLKLITPFFPFIFPNMFKWFKKTTGELLDDIFEDEELKLVLLANIQYYSDDPYQLSALIFAIAQAAYFKGGSHYIKGGSMKLSNYLKSFIEKQQGDVLLNNLVTKILTKDGKAIGVEYRPTKDKNAETTKIYGKHIIANASVPQVAEKLLPENESSILKEKISNMVLSNSRITLYLGFSKTLKELGNKAYSTFYFDPSIKTIADIGRNHRGPYKTRKIGITDYSQIDSGLAPVGKCVAHVCTPDYLKEWENLSDDEYKKKKAEVTEILIERMEEVLPGVKEYIEYKELSTPKTIKKFTLNAGGTSLGWAQLPSQATRNRLPIVSYIPGLYFASAWTFPSGGVTGVMSAGRECAEIILHEKE